MISVPQSLKHIPVPYFKINDRYQILERSEAAALLFPGAQQLSDILDPGSISKLTRFVKPPYQTTLELNVRELSDRSNLYELYQHWDEQRYGHLVLIRSQSRISELQERINRLSEDWNHMLDDPPASRKLTIAPEPTHSMIEIQQALQIIEDLVNVVRGDLVEADKGSYVGLIHEQISIIKEWLHTLR